MKSVATIELNPQVSTEEWHNYVKNHPDGTIYHLPRWRDVLVESFNHEPFYLFARNEGNKLCGMLPLFQIKSLLTGNRLVSLPFSYICGPIADSEAVAIKLVKEAERLCEELKCRYLEVRMMRPLSLGLEANEYFSTYVLELAEPQIVWKKLHQKGVRWAIGKARKDGVIVRVDNTPNGLKLFDYLNQRAKRSLGVPAHPLGFLSSITHRLSRFSKLYLAEVNGTPIAGIVTLSLKDTVCYAYGASDRRYFKYHPNDLLIWQAIEESCNQGYRYFDFGRTSPDDKGLVRFKKHWGTEQRKLYYYYFPRVPNLLSANRSGKRYKFVTSLWKTLPISLTRPLGSLVFQHLD